MSKMPGFNAVSSLSRPTRSYRTRASGIPSAISRSVMPQQLGAIGGVGGLGGVGIEPLPPTCSECEWTCTTVECKPPRKGCRREECHDVCRSVPCVIA
jgi:hypothetical protein